MWVLVFQTNNEEVRDSGSFVKKGSEPAFKRPRIETPTPLPTFKVQTQAIKLLPGGNLELFLSKFVLLIK